jgi:NifB/MoaA-like Fe-S oxidoreductase
MDAEGKRKTAPTTPAYAGRIIRETRPWRQAFRRRLGVDLVYLADEYYLTAGRPLPTAARYDGFPQYENGIGMTRSLIDDWRHRRRRLQAGHRPAGLPERITLVCGTLIAPVLQRIAREVALLTGVEAPLVPVENRLFGPRVTVSGLLGAADIVEALRRVAIGDLVVLPRHALDHAGALFLDGGTPEGVAKALGTRLVFASCMSDLLRSLPPAVQ